MTTFTLDLLDYTPITSALVLDAAPPAVQWYRQPHDMELRLATVQANVTRTDRVYRGAPTGEARPAEKTIPEVYQLLPDHVTPLSPEWCDLICDMNYPIPRDLAEKIYTDLHWAFNNASLPPRWDKPRVCGGALFQGTVDGSRLMIDSLLTSQPVPSAEWVLARRHLWFYGTQVAPNGNVTWMTLSANGVRVPIKLPLVFRDRVCVPLAWLHKLPLSFDVTTYDQRSFG
jgi:hypothetical protein